MQTEIEKALQSAKVADMFAKALQLKVRESIDFDNVTENSKKALQQRFKTLKKEKGIVILCREENGFLNLKKM
jgi:hypothetical protein